MENNKVIKLLEKNPMGLTLPEMAGNAHQLKKLQALRFMLTQTLRSGLVMPVSQRSGHTVYRLVSYLSNNN